MLFPLFLLGGLAMAIPIIVHLRNRAATTPERFPALRFLIKATVVTARWREPMRWLVLLLRLLAIAALIVAFAQPWFGGNPASALPPAVLLVDVSASMQAEGAFPQALQRAQQWLAARPVGTPVAVVAFDRSARVAVRLDEPVERSTAALSQLKPGWAAGDLDGALRAAERLLADYPGAGRIIGVATDGTATAMARLDFARPLAPGIAVEWLLPQRTGTNETGATGTGPANVAVTALRHDPSIDDRQQPLVIEATITNYGPRPRQLTVRCTSEVGSRQEREVALAAGASTDLRFAIDLTLLSATAAALTGSIDVVAANDALAEDDRRFFAVPTQGDQAVLRVAIAGSDDRVLAAATTPVDGGRFRWRVASDLRQLNPQTILVIDSGVVMDAAGLAALSAHRDHGGAIVVVASGAEPAGWERSILNLEISPVVKPLAPIHVSSSDLRHPVLQPFARPNSGDLNGFTIERWRPLTRADLRPLLTLDGGGALLAVTGNSVATRQGRMAVLAVGADRTWSDWGAHETIVPVWQQTLRWLAGTDGGRRAGALIGDPGTTRLAPGIDITANSSPRAVNLDPEESDLKRWTASAMLDRLRNPELAAAASAVATTAREAAGRQFAWWLLIAVAALSMAELWLANRTPR